MLGTGSVDLWVQSTATDADLEVVLSEVRPDGQEVLVQSGRLRASYRALERTPPSSTRSSSGARRHRRPARRSSGRKVRVLMPAFGHAFRAGSRIRIAVNTPGGDQATWAYELLDLPAGTRHLLGTGGPRRVVGGPALVPGQAVPTPLPPARPSAASRAGRRRPSRTPSGPPPRPPK